MGDEIARIRATDREVDVKQAIADQNLMKNFKPHFGKVYSFSGFRKAQNEFALDWALVDIEASRYMGNTLRAG
jgi:hypothetical protein